LPGVSIIAVDVGTSGCKAIRFAEDGRVLSRATVAYLPQFPLPGHAELHPDIFWNALCGTLRELAADESGDVAALCISSHGETFVPVDASGCGIGPAILNMDNRAIAEVEQIDREFGRRQLFETTGMITHPMYPMAKLLWLRKHDRHLFDTTAQFVSLTGYLLLKLGLAACIDYTLAARCMMFDITRKRWADDILEFLGVPAAKLPSAVPAGTVAGRLCGEHASRLGLRSQPLVVVGGHDQACAALGMGAVMPGRVTDSIGSYECLVAVTDEPVLNDRAFAASLNCYPHVVAGRYVSLAYFPSGLMMNWFRELLFGGDGGPGQPERQAEQYRELQQDVPEGPTGLCVTPYLIGTCNPDFNPRARAVITGLTASTGRKHIYKGILEGIACELRQVSGLLAGAIGPFSEMWVSGGGTHSRLGLELRAALSGRRLHVIACDEAVCLGSAILAGVATGIYSGTEEAVAQLVDVRESIEPDAVVAHQYEQQLRSYVALYPALTALRSC
jgi:xylulokinase